MTGVTQRVARVRLQQLSFLLIYAITLKLDVFRGVSPGAVGLLYATTREGQTY